MWPFRTRRDRLFLAAIVLVVCGGAGPAPVLLFGRAPRARVELTLPLWDQGGSVPTLIWPSLGPLRSTDSLLIVRDGRRYDPRFVVAAPDLDQRMVAAPRVVGLPFGSGLSGPRP